MCLLPNGHNVLNYSKNLTPSEMHKLGVRVTGVTGQAKLKVSPAQCYVGAVYTFNVLQLLYLKIISTF